MEEADIIAGQINYQDLTLKGRLIQAEQVLRALFRNSRHVSLT